MPKITKWKREEKAGSGIGSGNAFNQFISRDTQTGYPNQVPDLFWYPTLNYVVCAKDYATTLVRFHNKLEINVSFSPKRFPVD